VIKARAGGLLFFGLSRGNCEKLLQGKPIRIEGNAIGLPGITIVIAGGETEDAIAAELKEFVTDETVVTDTRRRDG
jgi:hypothetical protein